MLTPRFYFNFTYNKIKYSYYLFKKKDVDNKYILLDSEDHALIESYFKTKEGKSEREKYKIIRSSSVITSEGSIDQNQQFENIIQLCLQRNSFSQENLIKYSSVVYFEEISNWMLSKFKLKIKNEKFLKLKQLDIAVATAKFEKDKRDKKIKDAEEKKKEKMKKK